MNEKAENGKVEELVRKHGEEYRRVIEDALEFLKKREPVWGLDEPVDKDLYIQSIVERC